MKRISVLLLFPIFFSCDPARRIDIKNSSGGRAEIIWKIKEDSILSSPLFISNSKELKLDLLAEKSYNHIHLSVGVGVWTPAFLKNFADDLEAVEIRWKDGEILLSSEEEIINFLFARRNGIGRRKIKIEIKNSEQGREDRTRNNEGRSNSTKTH